MTRDLVAYRHCITCGTTFDFWKYDSLEDAGHGPPCEVRMLTAEEYNEAVKSCEEQGCFDE